MKTNPGILPSLFISALFSGVIVFNVSAADIASLTTACEDCHGKKGNEDGGSSADDDAGILAGQWMPYLEDQFKEYASDKRPMPKKMKPKMEKLTDDDIKALIHYYGSLQ